MREIVSLKKNKYLTLNKEIGDFIFVLHCTIFKDRNNILLRYKQ